MVLSPVPNVVQSGVVLGNDKLSTFCGEYQFAGSHSFWSNCICRMTKACDSAEKKLIHSAENTTVHSSETMILQLLYVH